MSEDRWRTRLRWVVVHPHDPAVLLARRDGALGELLGADALLLDCLDDHQDPAPGCSGRPCWPSGSRPTRPRPCSSTRGRPWRWSRRWPSRPSGGSARCWPAGLA